MPINLPCLARAMSPVFVGLIVAFPAHADNIASEPSASASCGLQLSGSVLAADGSHVYQTFYDAATWSGSVRKIAFDQASGQPLGLRAAPVWDADKLLSGSAALSPAPTWEARQLFLGRHQAGRLFSATEFRWDSLTNQQKGMLNLVPGHSRDKLGEHRLNYLRGERTREQQRPGGVFRNRAGVLGDIWHGSLIEVGAPATLAPSSFYSSEPSDAGYAAHRTALQTRSKVVYVGANDGMLHAFDADDGKELFAYLPDVLLPELSRLPQPDYVHRPYVDGSLAAGEVRVNGRWRTVLAAALRGGAAGVFALDTTDPQHFDAQDALWEFGAQDDLDIGQVIAAPLLAKFRVGGTALKPEYGYFVIIASGLAALEPTAAETAGKRVPLSLFLLSLDKSPSTRWREGTNYFKLTLSGAGGDRQALGTPALVLDAFGAVRHLYVGDLRGRLWHVEFAPNQLLKNVRPDASPLFVAKDATGQPQPISMQPRVAFAHGGGYQILFGTGLHLDDSDLQAAAFTPQSLYGVVHRPDEHAVTLARRDLAVLKLVEEGDDFRLEEAAGGVSKGNQHGEGWVVDLPEARARGERALRTPELGDGLVAFQSFLPRRSPCEADAGRWYLLHAVTGLPALATIGSWVPPTQLVPPALKKLSAKVGAPDAVGRRLVRRDYDIAHVPVADTGKQAGEPALQTTTVAGRLGWREIPNWQELHDDTNTQATAD